MKIYQLLTMNKWVKPSLKNPILAKYVAHPRLDEEVLKIIPWIWPGQWKMVGLTKEIMKSYLTLWSLYYMKTMGWNMFDALWAAKYNWSIYAGGRVAASVVGFVPIASMFIYLTAIYAIPLLFEEKRAFNWFCPGMCICRYEETLHWGQVFMRDRLGYFHVALIAGLPPFAFKETRMVPGEAKYHDRWWLVSPWAYSRFRVAWFDVWSVESIDLQYVGMGVRAGRGFYMVDVKDPELFRWWWPTDWVTDIISANDWFKRIDKYSLEAGAKVICT